MPQRCTRTNATLLAFIAGLAPLSGCSDRGGDTSKVAEAARELGSVGNADSPSGDGSYAQASAKISALDVKGEAASAVTAGLLGQSLQGEASVAINRATLAERGLFDELEGVLALGRMYESLVTEAAALEAFDPTADLDRIATEIRQLESNAQQASSDRSTLASRIGELESQASDLQSQSAEKRDQAAEMELASASLSATQAAARAGTIRTLTRGADALDMQISRLVGEVETLSPRLTELDAEIAKFSQQMEFAADAADDLRTMASERAARAQTARATASERAEQIRAGVNAIDSMRTDTVIPAGEEATQALDRAVRESEKSARQHRSPGTLGKATAKRRLGEMLHLRADGHGRYADALDTLAATAGMPGSEAYADAAQQERSTSVELRNRAAEAYENAASSLTAVNIRGVDTDRAQETADTLLELARLLRGEPAEEPAADPSADTPAP